MALYLISYDLDKPGQNYQQLINRLTQLGAKRVLYSQWLVTSAANAEAIRNDLLRFMDNNDRILVSELRNHAAWKSLMISDQNVLGFYKMSAA